uniref:Uncharacterized protein n=1 Tax=Arundo donax TaxID=35708 RepID=A0A0A9C2G7_ARUDO
MHQRRGLEEQGTVGERQGHRRTFVGRGAALGRATPVPYPSMGSWRARSPVVAWRWRRSPSSSSSFCWGRTALEDGRRWKTPRWCLARKKTCPRLARWALRVCQEKWAHHARVGRRRPPPPEDGSPREWWTTSRWQTRRARPEPQPPGVSPIR